MTVYTVTASSMDGIAHVVRLLKGGTTALKSKPAGLQPPVVAGPAVGQRSVICGEKCVVH